MLVVIVLRQVKSKLCTLELTTADRNAIAQLISAKDETEGKLFEKSHEEFNKFELALKGSDIVRFNLSLKEKHPASVTFKQALPGLLSMGSNQKIQ